MATLNFNANEVAPASSFDPVPAGKYVAAIIGSERKPTKAGTGEYLELIFELLDGPHRGRRVWARLNIENPNPKAVQIARGELSSLCRAVGVMEPRDSVELHNLPLCIKVTCKKRPDTGEIDNEVRGFEKKEAAFATQPAGGGVVTPPAAQVIDDSAPWGQN